MYSECCCPAMKMMARSVTSGCWKYACREGQRDGSIDDRVEPDARQGRTRAVRDLLPGLLGKQVN